MATARLWELSFVCRTETSSEYPPRFEAGRLGFDVLVIHPGGLVKLPGSATRRCKPDDWIRIRQRPQQNAFDDGEDARVSAHPQRNVMTARAAIPGFCAIGAGDTASHAQGLASRSPEKNRDGISPAKSPDGYPLRFQCLSPLRSNVISGDLIEIGSDCSKMNRVIYS